MDADIGDIDLEIVDTVALAADEMRVVSPADPFEAERLAGIIDTDHEALLGHVLKLSINRAQADLGEDALGPGKYFRRREGT